MEAYEYYQKETGKLYYKEAALELELTDDYINWLEQNVVKLFAIQRVGICTCGTEQYAEKEPREDGMTYCGRCGFKY